MFRLNKVLISRKIYTLIGNIQVNKLEILQLGHSIAAVQRTASELQIKHCEYH